MVQQWYERNRIVIGSKLILEVLEQKKLQDAFLYIAQEYIFKHRTLTIYYTIL